MIKKALFINVLIFIGFDVLLAFFFNNDNLTATLMLRQPHSYYHHGLNANVEVNENWGSESYQIITNSLGFKDVSKRKICLSKENAYRMLFIGDSFTEGVGVPYQQTFVGLLQKKYPAYDILNAGVISYSPRLYYLKCAFLINHLGLAFDELFVFIDLSDVQDEIVYKDYTPHPLQKKYWKSRIKIFLLQHSFFFNRFYKARRESRLKGEDEMANNSELYYKERNRWGVDENIFNSWGEEGVALAMKNMDLLYRLCQENQIRLKIAVYPWPDQIKAGLLHDKQVLIWEQFAEERDIPFINLFPIFINTELSRDSVIRQYFIKGDSHWNEAGHALVAKHLSLGPGSAQINSGD